MITGNLVRTCEQFWKDQKNKSRIERSFSVVARYKGNVEKWYAQPRRIYDLTVDYLKNGHVEIFVHTGYSGSGGPFEYKSEQEFKKNWEIIRQ